MKRDIKKLISEMTLEEKASLCSGDSFWHTKAIDRLGIPSIMLTDGPHGLRKQVENSDHLGMFNSIPATCFPSAAGLASSWDSELVEKVGVALGKECQAQDVAILLGPGANIKRSPLCGRNFEYFSEDPFLSSKMATSHIKGVQSQGVGTSLKHFAVNNQEHRRMTVDAIVDDRTLREIYLASFESVVKDAKPWTVMSSYNKVNGEFVSESNFFLTDILNDEWGFDGFVVSDWGGVNERVDGLAAGLDLEMPPGNGQGDRKIIEAINNGTLSEEKLNKSVERMLNIVFKAFDNKQENASYDKEVHHQLAREVAKECMVLLKNEDRILPLKKEGTIAVIGELARNPRYQGGGSSRINPTRLEDIFEEMGKVAPEANILYAQGYDLNSDDPDELLMENAKEAAKQSDVAVLFVGLPDRYESEGFDRKHLRIPENHRSLIEAVAEVQPNIVVVLGNGSPLEMPWIGKVKGLLESYLGGQALGGAIADLLFGDANPSGKLAETFPMDLRDNPSYLNFPGEGDTVEYKEGIFVGYRYYDTKGIEPLFPFGYGLSYTTYVYSNLTINKEKINDDETVEVTVTVKNTGNVAGKEIVQLYVSDVESTVIRPEKELKAFEKVELQPGEEKILSFTLDKHAFAYYNVDLRDWHVEGGQFEILIGKSSQMIELKGSVEVNSTITFINRVHRNTTLGDLLSNPAIAPVVQDVIERMTTGDLFADISKDSKEYQMFIIMMRSMPLRAVVSFYPNRFTEVMLNDLIKELNETIAKQNVLIY